MSGTNDWKNGEAMIPNMVVGNAGNIESKSEEKTNNDAPCEKKPAKRRSRKKEG